MPTSPPAATPFTKAARLFMRAAFVFVTAAGVSLFLLSEQTSAYFAWTIKPPITASFLGCGYLGVATALGLGLRESDWGAVRVGIWVVATGLISILIATLLHLDKFHLHSPLWTARVWAWSWLLLYVALVPGLFAALWTQWRQAATRPPSGMALAAGLRLGQRLLGGMMVLMGAALFLAPGSAEQLWPWSLSPLTARMVGSFYLAIGVSLFAAAHENNYARIRVANFAYLVFALLQLLTALRYPVVDWRTVPGLLLAAVIFALLTIGSIGVRASRRVPTIST
ncbi:MAG: hypothetical protein ABTR92_06560 [Candidatus Accumulibacter phosphatis]|uniref:hypothetical protein n=1 Tax=Candidatus Accumulibacter sp. ACC012 TaxID=2823332 RepID=UPI0025C338A0|nr:hypothetical protein [Candidatus Accumulibacter sp. ACC012]